MSNSKINVCFLHRQEGNKWEWFLSDTHGRALLKCTEQFNNYDEARMDYDIHREEFESRLDVR